MREGNNVRGAASSEAEHLTADQRVSGSIPLRPYFYCLIIHHSISILNRHYDTTLFELLVKASLYFFPRIAYLRASDTSRVIIACIPTLI